MKSKHLTCISYTTMDNHPQWKTTVIVHGGSQSKTQCYILYRKLTTWPCTTRSWVLALCSTSVVSVAVILRVISKSPLTWNKIQIYQYWNEIPRAINLTKIYMTAMNTQEYQSSLWAIFIFMTKICLKLFNGRKWGAEQNFHSRFPWRITDLRTKQINP